MMFKVSTVISMILSSLVVATTNAQINHGGLDVEFDNTLVLSETNGLVFYWSYQPEENEDVSMALRCLSSACEGYFAIGFNDVSTSPPYMINSHAIIGDCMVGNVANIHEYYLGGTTESQVTQVASTLSSQSCDVNESITTLRFSRPRIGPNYLLDMFGNQSQTIIYAIGFAGSSASLPTYHKAKGIASWPSDHGVPTSQPTVPDTKTLSAADCTIIGGGPGGVLAADVLSGNPQCNTLRLLERGGSPLLGTYTTLPFSDTFTKQPEYTVAKYNDGPLSFASVFGGQQTTNGGVFSPGSPEDVSLALGITLTEAAAAQECAAVSIEMTTLNIDEQAAQLVPNIDSQEFVIRNGLMAVCDSSDTEDSCDWGDMLFANTTTIRRRTVAHRIHGESIPDYALLDTEVDRIVFTEGSNPLVAESVVFADGTISPVASDGKVGKVFLAANALGSAKVLARSDTRWSSFVFHNHFHTYSYIPAHAVGGPHKDVWQYEFTTPDVTITNLFGEEIICPGQIFELDLRGNYPVASGIIQVVLMQMEPELRVVGTYDAASDELILNDQEASQCDIAARKEAVSIYSESWGVEQFSPSFAGFFTSPSELAWSQSWHFAGGIPLNSSDSKVEGTANVFSSDTGAIRSPFSCHTSMVSATAGVVSSMQALGQPITSCLEHISSSSNNADVMLSSDTPTILPSPRQIQVAASGPNELIMVTRTEISNGIEVLAARSYNGYEWDTTPPLLLPIVCDNTIDSSRSIYKTSSANMSILCNTIIPTDDFELYTWKIVVKEHAPLSDIYSVSRFLTQASFGATRETIDQLMTEHSGDMSSFISDQMNIPATLHRAYFRERANPIQVDTPLSGSIRSACAPGSRWMNYAFDAIYQQKLVVVMDTLESSPGHVSLSVGGHIRTIVPESHMSSATSATTYPITLDICKVTTRRGGKITLCNGKSFENPPVQFTDGDPVSSDRVVLSYPLLELKDVKGSDGSSAILDPNTAASSLVSSCDTAPTTGPLFAYDENSGDLYIESKRVALIENTLDSPAMSASQPLCTSAAKTFLNEHTCIPNLDACVTQSYLSADVPLNTDSIRKFYTLSHKYVYVIKGLQLVEDALNPMGPCNGKRSRWILDLEANEAGCDSWSSKPTNYTQMLLSVIGSQIQAGGDDNAFIRDLQLSPQVCTNDVLPVVQDMDTFVNVHVLVDSFCWRQTHPNEMNVYDFSGWSISHPGNSEALANGRPNPIKNPAELESTILNFPSWHPIERWDERTDGSEITYIGRYNDTIDFTTLPSTLQLPELASHFGASGSTSYSGAESCGSPGEVANDPSKGHQFKLAYGGTGRHKFQTTDRPGSIDNDIQNTEVQSAVWASVAVRAHDQLRQRVAWILSQIFVINEDSIGKKDMSEMYLTYYDIFVRNAFGNYRDIMREVALSPMMATMLSSLDSRSLLSSGYNPDENFAREIMQLFSFGLYRLNENGTRVTDDNGLEIETYSTADIENFARVWTGLKRRSSRSNIELQLPTINNIDPLKINRNYRDHTPKTDLSFGYLGDGVQVCSEMAPRSFLRIGATYKFMGRNHRTRSATVHPDEPVSKKPFIPNQTNSSLYAALCNADEDGKCAYASVVKLFMNLDCHGVECNVETVRMVAMEDSSGDLVYYEYVRPACVEMEFFENAKTIANSRYGVQKNNGESTHLMCANPKSLAAAPMCCDKTDQRTYRKGASECVYESERVSFSTAEARCEQTQGKELCEWGRSSTTYASSTPNECDFWKDQYHSFGWFPTPCELSAQVHSDGSINVVHSAPFDLTSNIHKLDSVEVYNVHWHQGLYPTVTDGCSNVCTVRAETCVCPTTVETISVFNDVAQLPTKDEIRQSLFIGAPHPDSFDPGVYVKCVSAACNSNPDVTVYSQGGSSSTPLLNTETIFGVMRGSVAGSEIFYSNAKSMVSIPGSIFSFRNPPKYSVYTEITERDAEYETEAAFDVYINHPSTPPFVAKAFIQHLITSNPTPRYVKSVAEAFKTGVYAQFGSGERGNMAATIAAVLMDREARSPILDFDLSFGKMREPLVKFIHMLRGLEVESNPGFNDIRLDDRIGQHPYRAPTVFNYFQYDHQPAGPLSQAGLVAPEAQLLSSPDVLKFMNYLNKGLDRSDLYSPTLVANEGDSAAVAVEELNMLLLAGRLNPLSRSVIEDAYNIELNSSSGTVWSASKIAQSLMLATPQFQTTAAYAPTQITRQSMEVDDLIYSQGAKVQASKYKHSSCDNTVYTKAEAHYKCNRDVNCQYLMDHKCWGTQYRLCTNANKIPGWYISDPTKQSCTLLKPQLDEPEQPSGVEPKAIVYLMLAGGADSWNMVAPYDNCEGGKDLYQQYANIRTNVAIAKTDLLPINATQLSPHSSQVCERFGLHPSLPNLQSMYNAGDMLLIANMGMLVEPLTKDEYNAKSKSVPFSLFAHNVQQETTQRVDAQTKRDDGVIGRMLDSLLKTKALKSSMYAIANDPLVLQPGLEERLVQQVSSDGPGSLDGIWSNHLSSIANLSRMTSESGFVETWSEKLEGAVAKNILHNSVMKNINLATNFGSTVVGKQLETVATLIRANTETFQDDITAYFVNLGGFDSHGDNTQFATRMIDVDNGLQKFKAEMEAQGQWDNVIIVQASEFGRSLTSNGKGTDHGWGGNYFLAGGSIRGGQILGEYPKDMTKNGKDMLSRGRVLPSTSWESVWNAIGQFMGVDDFEMNSVLPLRDNFDNLFDLEDVFDVIREPSPTPSSSPVASPIVSPTYVPSKSPTPLPTTQSPTLHPLTNPPTSSPLSPGECPHSVFNKDICCSEECGSCGGSGCGSRPGGGANCCAGSIRDAGIMCIDSDPPCIISESPTKTATQSPTNKPSSNPTNVPSTANPTFEPTNAPSTANPSKMPSSSPTSVPSESPSKSPTSSPTQMPTISPSISPSSAPSTSPTSSPSVSPTSNPSLNPSKSPSKTPSTSPSSSPTKNPSSSPSFSPQTTSVSPGECPHSVFNKDVCCAEECGTCGGSGCGSRPGGGANCCVSAIRDAGIMCVDSDPPCIIS